MEAREAPQASPRVSRAASWRRSPPLPLGGWPAAPVPVGSAPVGPAPVGPAPVGSAPVGPAPEDLVPGRSCPAPVVRRLPPERLAPERAAPAAGPEAAPRLAPGLALLLGARRRPGPQGSWVLSRSWAVSSPLSWGLCWRGGCWVQERWVWAASASTSRALMASINSSTTARGSTSRRMAAAGPSMAKAARTARRALLEGPCRAPRRTSPRPGQRRSSCCSKAAAVSAGAPNS